MARISRAADCGRSPLSPALRVSCSIRFSLIPKLLRDRRDRRGLDHLPAQKRGEGTPVGCGAGVQTPPLRPVQAETRSLRRSGEKLNPSASRDVSAHGGRSRDPPRVRQEPSPRSDAAGTLATAISVTNRERLMLVWDSAACVRMSRPVRGLQGRRTAGQAMTASIVFFSALGWAGDLGAFFRACSSLAPSS